MKQPPLYILVSLLLAAACNPVPGAAAPVILKGVGIEQRIDVQVPPDLVFRDETGQTVRLGDYFGKRPMILALVYYQCPMLCTVVLNDITRAMNSMQWTCGRDFDIVTVSFDPRETPELALDKKRQYLRAYRRPQAERGWHFLTGDQASITRLTQTVGFHYTWDVRYQQYAHASGIMVLTSEGKTARYFYGIEYAPAELERALEGAAKGQAAPPLSLAQQVLLFCFHYDPSTGRYSLAIMRVLQILGILTVLLLAGYVLLNLRRDRLLGRHRGTATEEYAT